MEENEIKEQAERGDEKIDGEVKIKLPVSEKLSNFWYHYKWHTIVAVFVLVIAVVLTVQLCSREKYDIYILYAGDKSISNNSSDGDISERTKFLNTFSSVCSDYDGDGDVNVAFKSLYRPDAEEIERRKSENLEIPESLIYEDGKTLSSLIAQSDYYLLFLDYSVFKECAETTAMIGTVDAYVPSKYADKIVRVANSSGIYLKDTVFYKLEGMRDLPEDTVICIKYTNAFASKADEEKREDAIEVFKRIVSL